MTKLVLNKQKEYSHVVIIGGGDLPIAAHILEKYPNVKKLTVCDIDERVTAVTRKYFTIGDIISKAVEDGRLEIIFEGGAEYMDSLIQSGKKGTVSGVIVDCTDFALDPDSLAAELFTPKFYGNMYELLEEGAGFSQQITKPYYKDAFAERAHAGGFEKVELYTSSTPEYGGVLPLAFCFR